MSLPMRSLSFFLTAALSSLVGELPRVLGGLFGELMIALQTFFEASWPNITAPSMTSSDSSLASDSTIITAFGRAGDDQVEVAFRDLRPGSG